MQEKDVDSFHAALLAYFAMTPQPVPHPVVTICTTPFDPEWLGALPPQIQLYAVSEIWKEHLLALKPMAPLREYLGRPRMLERLPAEARPSFLYFRLATLLIEGNFGSLRQEMTGAGSMLDSLGVRGWHALAAGDLPAALHGFTDDLARLRQQNNDPHATFTGLEGVLFLLALLQEDNFSHLPQIAAIIGDVERLQPHSRFLPAYRVLAAVVALLENRLHDARAMLHAFDPARLDAIGALLYGLARFWLHGSLPQSLHKQMATLAHRATAHGLSWLAAQYDALLAAAGDKPLPRNKIAPWRLVKVVQPQEPWQRALKALERRGTLPDAVKPGIRLAWWLRYDEESARLELAPKLQQQSSRGAWSKGRPLSLSRLREPGRLSFLGEQDAALCQAIISKAQGGGTRFAIDNDRALPALVNHPHLFLAEDPRLQVAIEAGEPELTAEEHGNAITVRFVPFPTESGIALLRHSLTRYKVVQFTEEHRRVAAIIGPQGLRIPQNAREELLATLGGMASFMTVHSSLAGAPTGVGPMAPDQRIRVHLLPSGSGLRAGLYVRPLGTAGPYLKPGEGPTTVTGTIGDQRVQTRRDLVLEAENADQIEANCPTLAELDGSDREWLIENPATCLELLEELRTMGGTVVVEWPEGERFSISPPAGLDQLYLNLHKKQDWFELDGHLHLDDSLVLDMRRLLELTQVAASRFIPLGQGHFLTLSNELRKRLDEIRTYAELRRGAVCLHPLATLALEDLAASPDHFTADQAWRQLVRRVRESEKLKPPVPSTFQAELRDYQLAGYRWLARLAHLGVGACLADDMGLGKTIQALALMVARAKGGPTLVVAPTSVCLNWQVEANRFAPTLEVTQFSGRRRRELLANLGPFKVVIASYGLLQQDAEAFAAIEWQTIVLDEAQAIKNFLTKRSRAAMELKGRFKFLTTGTPIENHLSELWNLFQFINPGLLGTLEQFSKRFIAPIEREDNPEARRRLKKLVQPFILRRLKPQVLEELPPRTEITLQVTMHRQEAALYEALRQKAVARLRAGQAVGRARHLKILTEIMKLRRACCHPRLVLPGTEITGAKLELFGKVVAELLENRHKALVFSQFVDHLTILRGYLEQQGIRYQYLDGKTPATARQKRVAAFQAGEGDLFLISLKAGGMGLNLTAADYVIHMDPWWNPAVEDQASDRAHRIGQQHPVTIYRLITSGSIEEKICALHARKKELAESLLAGTESSRAISSEELLALLTDRPEAG
ncbi:MAG: DEAD/DEAH box helicase [Thermodesulfobacteriota bacterium]